MSPVDLLVAFGEEVKLAAALPDAVPIAFTELRARTYHTIRFLAIFTVCSNAQTNRI